MDKDMPETLRLSGEVLKRTKATLRRVVEAAKTIAPKEPVVSGAETTKPEVKAAPEKKPWKTVIAELSEDPFAKAAYGATGSYIAVAAAYYLKEEIGSGVIGEEKFVGLVKEIATMAQVVSKETFAGGGAPDVPTWGDRVREMSDDQVATTVFGATDSVIAAVTAFTLRSEIKSGVLGKDDFKAFVQKVATRAEAAKTLVPLVA